MATGARLVGGEQLKRDILALSPARRKVTDPALSESMLLALSIAADQKIKRGGKAPPIKGKLTSRLGTLRSSLGPSEGVDESGLSRGFIEGGTALVYGAVHEFGNVTHPPRPFLKPALDDAVARFPSIFVKHWKRAAQL